MFNLFKRNKQKTEAVKEDESNGVIGEYYEGDKPVILKFVNEIPNDDITSRLTWFTVISWKYDGSARNGMPPKETNSMMLDLEHALDACFDSNEICRHAYNRTGNDLKEFNYYIADRDEFMMQFNKALSGHTPYPIEISFYSDPEWTELRKMIKDFEK